MDLVGVGDLKIPAVCNTGPTPVSFGASLQAPLDVAISPRVVMIKGMLTAASSVGYKWGLLYGICWKFVYRFYLWFQWICAYCLL